MKSWSSLSVEILEEILKRLDEHSGGFNTFFECAIVCKSWTQPTQVAMYKSVYILDKSKLLKFLRSLRNKPELGRLVETLGSDVCEDLYLERLLGQLPLLKNLFCTDWDYSTLLNAIKENKLPHLKYIAPPRSDSSIDASTIQNYASCALLLKERLENLTLVDEYGGNTSSIKSKAIFDHLFNHLDQFKQLTSLNLEITTNNEIEIFEKVSMACPTLKTLTIALLPDPWKRTRETGYSGDSFIFESNNILETLLISGSIEYKLILYILRKYPNLVSIDFTVSSKEDSSMDPVDLNQLMTYLSKVKLSNMYGLKIMPQAIVDTYGISLNNTKIPQFVMFQYAYGDRSGRTPPATISLRRNYNTENEAYISYHECRGNDMDHMKFLEVYGKSITSLKFEILARQIVARHLETASDHRFIAHAVEHCPNLNELSITSTYIDPTGFKNDLRKRMKLKVLDIKCKKLYTESLKKLSLLFAKIDRLQISADMFCRYTGKSFYLENNHGGNDPILNLHMPQTSLGFLSLTLGDLQRFNFKKLHLKLCTKLQGERYYIYDESKTGDVFKPSRKQVYDHPLDQKKKIAARIYIACESLEEVHVKNTWDEYDDDECHGHGDEEQEEGWISLYLK